MKKLDQQYSPPTYNVSTVGYSNSDESMVLDYVPVSEDGFQNFGQMENTDNLTSSIQYIPAMNEPPQANFVSYNESNEDLQQNDSPTTTGTDKPLRFRRQPKTKSDQPLVDNFQKQSHMFFVPSAGSISSPSPNAFSAQQEDNLNVSLGYSVPEFIPSATVMPQQHSGNIPPLHHQGSPTMISSYQSDFSSSAMHNSGMSSVSHNDNGYVQHHSSANSFQAYPSYQAHQNIPTQKEFKPASKAKQSMCSRLLKYLIVLIMLAILGAMIYGGFKVWANNASVLETDSSNYVTQQHHQQHNNRLEIKEEEEEVLVDKEEPQIAKPNNPPPVSEVPSNTDTNTQTQEREPTLTNNEPQNGEQANQDDPYNFYDPFKNIKTDKAPKPKKKKQIKPKKKVKVQIPQEIYDRVYPKKKKSGSNESKFGFMDEKIEKYLDNLSEKEYNKLSNTNKELIKKYIRLREKESFEQHTAKSSSGKYKKKGIRKKKAKTNPYEFDYAKNDDDEMQISSDPKLPVKTVRDKKGKIHHVDPFGINEHENNEAYDEDVKNYMKNPDHEKYINKYDEDEDDDY
ncbi:Hypothetical protein NAEGRDRAFT_78315 [Naegleria gruberi]|uniref:Uncharacterized protein n=1 Tax=Naegleria gruberi TaxID=5762 RepID=D2V2P9_NAEGR|nr:uncharacterized protein NAEGRDRAFT_78315 [Naegleria gruberi]EFC49100.1 Hypothetical protein NAEGRDRAFT_78315 [Naegleria gruberi]|eukprot:XP_002681844.1 Hypothetical protein NAEGRDRAFT_78315 [Naegleria gruberi strain NEG-M]